MFLICPATNFLVDSNSAAAERWRQRGGGGQRGSGVGSRAMVVAERWQHGGGSVAAGSMAVVAVRRQCGGGKHGGGVGSAAAAALAARQWRPAWRLRQKFGGIAASAAAAER